jgi:hypothetical protein
VQNLPSVIEHPFILQDERFKSHTVCVLPQLAISEHFTVNLHKSSIVALSFNFALHRQLWQHAVTCWRSCPPSRAVLVSQRFYSYCPVVVRVSLFRLWVGKKIKTPKSGRKK